MEGAPETGGEVEGVTRVAGNEVAAACAVPAGGTAGSWRQCGGAIRGRKIFTLEVFRCDPCKHAVPIANPYWSFFVILHATPSYATA
jgi:hypothetical protein